MDKTGSFVPFRDTLVSQGRPIRVSLVAIPDAMLSTLSSIYDALNCFDLMGVVTPEPPRAKPFEVEILTDGRGDVETASGLPVVGHRSLEEVERTDVVIVPSMLVADGEWIPGRYPRVVKWLSDRHREGAMLCSACSGVLLLAETGLLDNRDATIHWAYARTFRANFPEVNLRAEQILVTTGDANELVMSGASASWHDLVLYLVARHVGPRAAQAIAKFMLLQWHEDGQAAYAAFRPPRDHGDAAVLDAQAWFEQEFATATPVEAAVRRAGIPERSFKRRFAKATGLSPIRYVQQVRIEEAKRLLETSNLPVDQVSWDVGYGDPAFFGRLFKRITRMTPSAYRRKFRLPDFAITDLRG